MLNVTLLKNVLANVLRGSAAALVAIVLPPFLTRILPNTTFGAWVLILQLSAYVGYLDFGIQTTVGRFVAHANELGDAEQRDRIVNTSLAILAMSAVLAIAIIGVLAWQLPNLFHDMPSALYADSRLALLFVGGSSAVGLPFSVFNGIFIGLQRNEVPAIIIGGGKLLGALLVIIIARMGGGLALMGAALAIVNIGSYVVQFLVSRLLAKEVRIKQSLISKQAGYEIFSYCFSLTIWSFAMLLISGLDTTIVGFLDFASVAYYSVAATLIVFIAGLQTSIFSVLIPSAAILGARGDALGLGKLLITSTRYGMFILLLTGVPLAVFAEDILHFWVGPKYAISAAILLQILVCANILRFSLSPYASLLIGTGQQKLIVISPLVEGFTNLLVSVIAGYRFGVVGVAIGTLVGSLVVYGLNLFYNMPRSKGILFSRRAYLRDGVLRPLLCAAPFGVWALLFTSNIDAPLALWIGSLTITLVLTLRLLWRLGLITGEREWLELYAIRAMRSFTLRTSL